MVCKIYFKMFHYLSYTTALTRKYLIKRHGLKITVYTHNINHCTVQRISCKCLWKYWGGVVVETQHRQTVIFLNSSTWNLIYTQRKSLESLTGSPITVLAVKVSVTFWCMNPARLVQQRFTWCVRVPHPALCRLTWCLGVLPITEVASLSSEYLNCYSCGLPDNGNTAQLALKWLIWNYCDTPGTLVLYRTSKHLPYR